MCHHILKVKTTTEQINTGVPWYPRETSSRALPHTPNPRMLKSLVWNGSSVCLPQPQMWNAEIQRINCIPANQLSENTLISRTHTEILQLSNKKTTEASKKWAKEKDIPPKKIYKWAISKWKDAQHQRSTGNCISKPQCDIASHLLDCT